VALVILLGVAVGGWWYLSSQEAATVPVYDQLFANNEEFRKAQEAMAKQAYDEAADHYRAALQSAQDPGQVAYIRLSLGTALNLNGNRLDAIAIFKELAADATAPDMLKAYAVQYMGRMLNSYGKTSEGDTLRREIFKDRPYASMVDSDDDSLTIRHVYEYASSFYPLAISELRIADWYLKYMQYNGLSTTTPPGSDYVQLVLQKITSAEADIARTNNFAAGPLVPEALERKAVVMSQLAHRGVLSLEEAVAAYQAALDAYAASDLPQREDSSVRFAYAGFLAHTHGAILYGQEAFPAKVHEIISPLYLEPAIYARSTMGMNLPPLRTARSTTEPKTVSENNKLRAMQIAFVDTGFKEYLLALGWSENDFLPDNVIEESISIEKGHTGH
jgi:tetratricopeptide (TPR) repeat protein